MSRQWDDHPAGCHCNLCIGHYVAENGSLKKSVCPCGFCRTFRANTEHGSEAKIGVIRDQEVRAISEFIRDQSTVLSRTKLALNSQYGRRNVATINLCNRCGSMGQSNAMGSIIIRKSPVDYDAEEQEICPGCVAAFVELYTAPTEPSKNAYRKPYKEEESKSVVEGLSDDELAQEYLRRAMTKQLGTGEDDA